VTGRADVLEHRNHLASVTLQSSMCRNAFRSDEVYSTTGIIHLYYMRNWQQ